MRIFKNNFNKWQTTCYGKDLGGNESKYYMSVNFAKCNEPTQAIANIEVKKFFMTSYFSKSGLPQPKMVITEYELEDDGGNK